ncbi:hypothetical protein BEL07_24445 [Mycolicibacterium grossiae]|uniref:Uncharacterized protein n=2 Tax=Mycolicibacterium grossiae TaxID=1552759 RepID=A0A1E8PZV6_9MYCO|nr:hypothetical protein BEL07_24445 [Mycolicibacterium grossiae]
MKNRLVLGIAAAAVAVSGFATAIAAAEPAPPPGPTTTAPVDGESMITHCTEQLPEAQRGPAADSMRQMMASNMAGASMGEGHMGMP